MLLDTRTIVFLTALGALMLGLAMWVSARSYERSICGMERWALGSYANGGGWLLFSGRDLMPDFWAITLSNTLLLLSVAFHAHALREFTGQRVQRWPYFAVAIVFALFVVFTHFAPNIGARTFVISLALGLLLIHCASIIGRARFDMSESFPQHTTTQTRTSTDAPPPLSYRLTRAIFGIYGVTSLARAFSVFFVPVPNQFFAPNPALQILFLLVHAAGILVTYGFVLMCSDKFHLELQSLARRDLLTGALNRGTIELLLQKEWSRAARTQSPLGALLLDMDSFKKINDTYGHAVGDEVLIGCVRLIHQHIRSSDTAGRFGGEEFLIVLPNTEAEMAHRIAQRLCDAIAASTLAPSQPDLRTTASIGLAVAHFAARPHALPHETPAQLLQRADIALYAAKREGRNRVVLSENVPTHD